MFIKNYNYKILNNVTYEVTNYYPSVNKMFNAKIIGDKSLSKNYYLSFLFTEVTKDFFKL